MAIASAACSARGRLTSDEPDKSSSAGAREDVTSAGASTSGGSAGTPDGVGGGGAGAGPDDEVAQSDDPLLPARIRRMTNAEYDASVQTLLGTTTMPSVDYAFPPDARQGPSNAPAGPAFTVNDAQRVDPLLVGKLDAAAQGLVAEARANGKLAELAPCADPTGAGEQCALDFLQSFGARAFRRAPTDAELEFLVTSASSAYHVAADGYSYDDGIDLVTRVILQTPAFLYLTELGDGPATGTIALTPEEIATQLAYLLTGAPPDAELMSQASAGDLATPEGREAAAKRLLDSPAGHARSVRVVREWLGIESVARREKAAGLYPEFPDVSKAMEDESYAFIDEVLHRSTGTLSELLTADWTIVSERLASFYGVPWGGEGQHTSLASVERRGILNQGAFLSVFASNNGSHPVYRGVAVMRRLTCLETPDPGALGLVVTLPPADPSKTTRERFSVHATDPGCAGCHSTIDALGFALENFDGIGRMRATENEHPIDTSTTLKTGEAIDGEYADSMELFTAFAKSDLVKACLARQIFRSTAARSNGRVAKAEEEFVDTWKQLPSEQQDRLADVLIAYVKSPNFTQRSPQ